jgi:hypothetical protein
MRTLILAVLSDKVAGKENGDMRKSPSTCDKAVDLVRLAGLGWLKSRAPIYRTSSVLMVLVGNYFIVQGIRY